MFKLRTLVELTAIPILCLQALSLSGDTLCPDCQNKGYDSQNIQRKTDAGENIDFKTWWNTERTKPGWSGLCQTGKDFSKMNILGANFKGVEFKDCCFFRAKLSGANLSGAVLSSSCFRETIFSTNENEVATNLSGAKLVNARLYETDFTNAILDGAVLDSARFYYGAEDLLPTDKTQDEKGGSNLTSASLRNVSLRKAVLTKAVMIGTDLTSARVQEADLEGASLRGAILVGADLSGAIGPAIFPTANEVAKAIGIHMLTVRPYNVDSELEALKYLESFQSESRAVGEFRVAMDLTCSVEKARIWKSDRTWFEKVWRIMLMFLLAGHGAEPWRLFVVLIVLGLVFAVVYAFCIQKPWAGNLIRLDVVTNRKSTVTVSPSIRGWLHRSYLGLDLSLQRAMSVSLGPLNGRGWLQTLYFRPYWFQPEGLFRFLTGLQTLLFAAIAVIFLVLCAYRLSGESGVLGLL